ncbi:competence protein ComEA [Streptomyces candidus]|uniref:Competence protein ComEA n=1 Tax=Streptomyces candidus TaxID=67283 RepID=A0A7X0LMS0_9ACTN|nr:ComEA family DNA-binding protein [Streptomyces candidus]MBB6434097.1 competence protein ComEA [Streptomyces candidus]GHH33333.1 hypothetical protein GCM10018773_03730 [Streptomyces candidus]
MEPKTVGALAAVLVVSTGFAVHHFWAGRPHTVQAPETVGSTAIAVSPPAVPPGQPTPVLTPSAIPEVFRGASTVPQAAGGAIVVVDVAGEVKRPGVLHLPAGSRVADALREAGGITSGTDTTGLNRARVLTDGEQVVVGGPAPPTSAVGGGPGAGNVPSSAGGQPNAPLSLNTATVEQLDTLPGVGPVLARHIADYRTQHGGFRSVEELREVRGIGDRRFADLQSLVRP